MKVINTSLTDFLQKAGCFEIPYFQRNYCWSQKHWQQLFDDILSLSRYENMKKHFLGTIVYESDSLLQISKINTVKLIDGQQRLITISLFLCALQNISLKSQDEENISIGKEIFSNLLTNHDEEYPVKILMNEESKEIYTKLIEGEDNLKTDNKIFKAYDFFKNQIEKSNITPSILFDTIQKLEIVDMALEKDIDNAQLIFDSLNSTGMRLSQTDQIKNFVLLGADEKEQKNIYKNYWLPMEEYFSDMEYKDNFEDFIKDYLTIQNNGIIPKKDCLYEEFNKFYITKLKLQNRRTIMKHILKYSKYYIKLLSSNISDKDARVHIQKINDINAKDAYPFLMEVFEDFDSNLIDKDILVEILSTVERFVSNREKLTHPESTFTTLSNDVNQMLALKNFTPKIIPNQKKMTINDLLEENISEDISA